MESVRLACVSWPLLWIPHLLLASNASARPVVFHPDRSMRVQVPTTSQRPGCVLYVYVVKRWNRWGDGQVLSTLDVRTARAPWLPPGPELVHLPCNHGIGTVHGPPRTSLLHAVRVCDMVVKSWGCFGSALVATDSFPLARDETLLARTMIFGSYGRRRCTKPCTHFCTACRLVPILEACTQTKPRRLH
jgi:hypothetical protein